MYIYIYIYIYIYVYTYIHTYTHIPLGRPARSPCLRGGSWGVKLRVLIEG